MLYDITLKVSYAYDDLADAGRHVLRLVPRGIPGEQRVIASRLSVRPKPAERTLFTDFFGNACVEIAYDRSVQETEFLMQARVERHAPDPLFDVSPDRDGLQRELERVLSLDPQSPHHFCGDSGRIRRDPIITAWAAKKVAGCRSTLDAVETLCRALHDHMTFDAEATAVDTPIEEAFAQRRGVCQDFSHIAIVALRGNGIPAGYMSGFLRTNPPQGQPRLEGADAMHAWIQAWCGMEIGWVEYDPTNAVRAGEDHVVIAHGRDYFDVSPVRGALRTAGTEKTSHSVDVVAVTG